MNLKSMVLEEMDDDERKFYFPPKKLSERNAVFSRIIKPISFYSYEELISEFMQHPCAKKLSLKINRECMAFLDDYLEEHEKEIAELLESGRFRVDLRLFFQKPAWRGDCPAEVHFYEHKGLITATRAFVPYYMEDLFRMSKCKSFYGENKAVAEWVRNSDSVLIPA